MGKTFIQNAKGIFEKFTTSNCVYKLQQKIKIENRK